MSNKKTIAEKLLEKSRLKASQIVLPEDSSVKTSNSVIPENNIVTKRIMEARRVKVRLKNMINYSADEVEAVRFLISKRIIQKINITRLSNDKSYSFSYDRLSFDTKKIKKIIADKKFKLKLKNN